MEWKVEDPTVQSSGACLQAMVEAFGELKIAVSRLLVESGVGELGRDGVVRIDPNAWYPIRIELDTLRRMRERVGENAIFQVGTRIPASVVLPPTVVDVDTALASLDVAYHMNHGRDGVPLFDPATGRMSEGIGHFEHRWTSAQEASVTAPGPFPCALNRGIVTGLVRRFQPRATVELDASRPSLGAGGATSTYVVRW